MLCFLQIGDQLLLGLLVFVLDYLHADLLFEFLYIFDPIAQARENVLVLFLANDARRSELLTAVLHIFCDFSEAYVELVHNFDFLANHFQLLVNLLLPLRHEVGKSGQSLFHLRMLVIQLEHLLRLGILEVLQQLVHLFDIALYSAIQAIHFLLGECFTLPYFFFYLIVFFLLAILSVQDSLSELLSEEDDTFDRRLDRSRDIEPLIFFDEIVDLVNFGHQFPFHGFS